VFYSDHAVSVDFANRQASQGKGAVRQSPYIQFQMSNMTDGQIGRPRYECTTIIVKVMPSFRLRAGARDCAAETEPRLMLEVGNRRFAQVKSWSHHMCTIQLFIILESSSG